MRLTDEMVREDDRRYRSYNILAELIWCGREVYHRKSITNDNIRFQAWLCRAAADLLKKQQEKDQCLKGKCRICPHCDHCDVDENGHLKEQEAHILTIDQLEDALDTVVWIETPVSENLADGYSLIMEYSHKYGYIIVDSPFGDDPSQDRLEYSEYGKSWRCWDKRPTDEQRKAAKWDE